MTIPPLKKYREGDIVNAICIFGDMRGMKLRPVVLTKIINSDTYLGYEIHDENCADGGLKLSDEDHKEMGLKKPSVITNTLIKLGRKLIKEKEPWGFYSKWAQIKFK